MSLIMKSKKGVVSGGGGDMDGDGPRLGGSYYLVLVHLLWGVL